MNQLTKNLLCLFIILISSISLYANEYKIKTSDSTNVTPQIVTEDNNRVMVSTDILDLLGISQDILVSIVPITKDDTTLIYIDDLVKVLNIEYKIKNNSIILYNKVLSVTTDNDTVNIKLAFIGKYEYYINNNKLVINTFGTKTDSNPVTTNNATKVVKDISIYNIDKATKYTFNLYNNAKNTQRITESKKDIAINFKDIGITNVATIGGIIFNKTKKGYIITLKKGITSDITPNLDVFTGDLALNIQNGEVNKHVQRNYTAKNIKITATPNSIKATLPNIMEVTVKDNNYDKIIYLTPLATTNKNIKDIKVTLDAGHGGNESGATYKELKEKDINLKATMFVKDALEKEGIMVVLTRKNTDEDPNLAERGQLAIDTQSDLFISIHSNSTNGEDRASGFESYYHMDIINAKYFGNTIFNQIIKDSPLPDRGCKSDSILYNTGLGVLRQASTKNVPATLIELGFMNHSFDRAYLLDDSYLQKVAADIAIGIKNYLTGKPINQFTNNN